MRKAVAVASATCLLAAGGSVRPAQGCADCDTVPFEHCVLETDWGYEHCTQPVNRCELEGVGCGPFASLFTLDGSVRYVHAEPAEELRTDVGVSVEGDYTRRACDEAILARDYGARKIRAISAETSEITF